MPQVVSDAPALLDVRQVATALHCSPRTTRRLADSGQLPAPIKLGSLVRWRRSDIEQWLNSCSSLPAARGEAQQ